MDFPPNKELLIKMLKYEDKLRLSKEYVDTCTEVKEEVNGWLRITKLIQKKVAYDFGYIDKFSNMVAVNYLRRAQYIYPDLKNLSVYVRNNHAKILPKFNIIPNLKLYDLSLNQINLDSLINNKKHNLLIGSSAT